jgi:carbon storage regulator
MLVLKRKQGQSIDVGENVRIILQEVRGGQVKVAIVAPRDVRVKRSEIKDSISRENLRAAASCTGTDQGDTGISSIDGLFKAFRGKEG